MRIDRQEECTGKPWCARTMSAVRFINEGVKIPSAICWMWARKTSQGIAKVNIRLRKLSVTRSGAAGRESKNYSLPNFITNQIANSEFIKVENQITLQGQMMFLPNPVDDLSEGYDAEAKEKAKKFTKPGAKFNSIQFQSQPTITCKKTITLLKFGSSPKDCNWLGA